MPPNAVAKVQHYVPQFLLRHFGVGKKKQIHVFDKQTGKVFKSSPRNVAAESRYYDFEINGVHDTAELNLARLEEKSAEIVKKLLNEKNIRGLTEDERGVLAAFCAVQMTRTRASREMSRSLREDLVSFLRASARGDDDRARIEEYIGPEPDENQATVEAVDIIYHAVQNFAAHFLAKVWMLMKTDGRHPFYIGDNPLGKQNTAPHGKLGLAVRGIELYLPLTPKIVLAMYCPSLVEKLYKELREFRNHMRILARTEPLFVEQVMRDPLSLEQTVAAIDAGRPLSCSPETVVNINSIQIKSSERYVFSNIDDFRLARSMLKATPSLRTGPRITQG
jgi:hypothetical protein